MNTWKIPQPFRENEPTTMMTQLTDSIPLHILIVEGSENDYLVTHGLLKEGPFSDMPCAPIVRWASGYEAGVAAIKDESFDVFLVDLSLQPQDGFAFLDECSRLSIGTPIILLAGREDYTLDLEAMRRGAADFLEKDGLTAAQLERSIRYSVERSKTARQLLMSNLENRRILESAHCLLLITDVAERDGDLFFRAVVSNEEMAQQIVPLDIPSALTFAEALYYAKDPEDRRETDAVVINALMSGLPGFQAEYRVTDSRGAVTWLFEDTRIEVLGKGHWRLTAVCSDVTERRRLDDEARATHVQMTELVRTALDAIIVMDEHGVILEFNPAAESIFGYAREQVVGFPVVDLLIPEDGRDRHKRGMAAYLETGAGLVVGARTEQTALHADGSTFPIELAVTAIRIRNANFFIGFVRDITSRIKAENEIRSQSQRIESDRTRLAQAQALAGTGSWSFDVPTQSLTLSDEFFRIAGYEPGAFEVTWTNFLECMVWQDRHLVITADMFDGPDQAPPPDQLVRVRRPDGELRTMLSRTRATYDPSGNRIRVDGTMADITDRRKAEEDLDRFFSMSLDLLSISSVDGYFKRINPAFEKVLGYSIPELLAEPYINFVHPDDRAATVDRIEGFQHGTSVDNFTNRYRRRDGSYRWLLWTTAVYGDQLYSVAHDVTPLREAENRLRLANEDLEIRVAGRTAALEEANIKLTEAMHEADRANQAKSEFLSRMSHELRTPLNSILGFGQIILLQSSDEQINEHVSYILKGGRHLLQVINEVLDLARVEAGYIEVSIEDVELELLVQECIELAQTIADEHLVRLILDVSDDARIFALADRRRLMQVILNIISNGIKYNAAGGSVTIKCTETVDARVQISLQDTGIGLRTEDIPKLFTPFERLGAGNSRVEGTGLGLSLSKRLMTLMGGTIEVESQLGVGTKFTVILPQAIQGVESEGPSEMTFPRIESGNPAEGDFTVLCVEDNPLNIRLYESIFARRKDVTLLTARTGLEGVEIAVREQPDIILLDLNLPDVSGREVLHILKRTEAVNRIPVLIVSADATKGQIAHLMAVGANGYLTKPLDVPELLRTIDASLVATRAES